MLIIAGIGLNSFEENKLKKIILAGADVLRYNLSYRSIEENRTHIELAKRVIHDLNTEVKILLDLPINKIRLGDFDIKTFSVRENDTLNLKSASYSPDCNLFIPIDTQNLGKKVAVNQTITIGDGEIAIQITKIIDNNNVEASVLNNGVIRYVKSFNIDINEESNLEKLLEKYKFIIENTKDFNPDYVAMSYINQEFNEKIKKINFSHNTKKIIKIENTEGVKNFKKICQDPYFRMVMLDRGELGVNLPYEESGIVQNELISIAKKYKKPIIISTQILESTVNNFIPYKSEITGLTNMVIDGVSGIMLCQETAVGLRPAYSISVAKKIIEATKKYATR